MNDSIKVAEHFYSIQCEGMTIGQRAIFLRLSMCDFDCSWCDTTEVWKKGTYYPFTALLSLFEKEGYIQHLNRGAHLIITGGNPLIQQKALVNFLDYCTKMGIYPAKWYIEVETQGSVMPMHEFASYVNQWNVSPKLANSGMPKNVRIKPSILEFHAARCSVFKFPVALQSDIDEVLDIIEQAAIPHGKVALMPICDTRAGHIALAEQVVEWCKMYDFDFSPRLQLLIWDKACGV